MTEYHTVYKGPEGETTEWEDIQVRLGNFVKREPAWKPDKYVPEEEVEKGKEWLKSKDEAELSDLEDDDALADDQFLEQYRRQRIQELQRAALKPRFGTVEQIRGSEFVGKVTNAGNGVYVVLLLLKDGNSACELAANCLVELAEKFPHTKFLKAISTDIIPNYPDSNLPTILLYHETKCLQTLVGPAALGGRRTTPEQLAFVLNKFGPVCGDNTDEQEAEQVKSYVQRMVKEREHMNDEDSDFD